MKILYYKKDNKLQPGIVTEKGIIDISNFKFSSGEKKYSDENLTIDDIDEIKLSKEIFSDESLLLSEADILIGPCVPSPSKIICL